MNIWFNLKKSPNVYYIFIMSKRHLPLLIVTLQLKCYKSEVISSS